jgi:hypothetical protein
MKYINKFATMAEYNAFKNSSNYVTPNLNLIVSGSEKKIYRNPKQIIECNYGDIVYIKNNVISVCPLSSYSSSKGNVIGVIVIPSNILPDSYPRMIGINAINSEGYPFFSSPTPNDSSSFEDSALNNYIKMAYYNSDGYSNFGTITENNGNGVMSPYTTGNTLNPDYIIKSGIHNCFCDFKGLQNTITLVTNQPKNVAANVAYNYGDGYSVKQWYLPSIGELGFLAAKLTYINNSITSVGGDSIDISTGLWSSTEYNAGAAWNVYFGQSTINNSCVVESSSKSADYHVRPFALLN